MSVDVASRTTANAPFADTPVSRPGTPTWEIAYQYPLQGEWTEEAFLAMPWEFGVELADGCVEFLPMTPPRHMFPQQVMLDRLSEWLSKNRPGWVAFPPKMPIRLQAGRFRDPDVRVLSPGNMPSMDRQPEGAELVVEVVSPGAEARERDYEVKRADYAEAGIPEYWIIDPEQQKITVLTLAGTEYRVHGEFGPGSTADSVLLPGFQIEVDLLFAAAEQGRKE